MIENEELVTIPPWGKVFIRMNGYFLAFESIESAEKWIQENKKKDNH